MVKRQSEDNLFRKNHDLLGLLDLPVAWWFSKMSVFCLSGHLSARLSTDIYALDFFDFFHVTRNIQKSRPISAEKSLLKNELSGFLKCYCLSQWVYWTNLFETEFIFSTHQEIATK